MDQVSLWNRHETFYRKAWSALNKLTGRKRTSRPATKSTPSANVEAKRLVDNGKFANYDKILTREAKSQRKETWNSHSVAAILCSNLIQTEIISALKTLKVGRSPGLDKLHPECVNWLLNLI